MTTPSADHRSPEQRRRDEQVATEPALPPPDLLPGAPVLPVEVHLARQGRRPVAVAGIVENGVVRPVDPNVKLPERAKVIIVAAE